MSEQAEVVYLGHHERLTAHDEQLHPLAEAPGLWGDTIWLDLTDPKAGVFGSIHLQLTNQGFGRFQTHFFVDGVQQSFARRVPFDLDPTITKWSDGHLTYEVREPFERIGMTVDTPKLGVDVEYRAR